MQIGELFILGFFGKTVPDWLKRFAVSFGLGGVILFDETIRQKAKDGKLSIEEMTGGTFSISNFGSFGSIFATPVINQPQVAILGVGAVQKEPVVVDDAIAIRSTAYLALTFDHRLIDGALADQFTSRVKAILEDWSEEV